VPRTTNALSHFCERAPFRDHVTYLLTKVEHEMSQTNGQSWWCGAAVVFSLTCLGRIAHVAPVWTVCRTATLIVFHMQHPFTALNWRSKLRSAPVHMKDLLEVYFLKSGPASRAYFVFTVLLKYKKLFRRWDTRTWHFATRLAFNAPDKGVLLDRSLSNFFMSKNG